MNVVLSSTANLQFEQIALELLAFNSAVAERFVADIDKALQTLGTLPESGRLIRSGRWSGYRRTLAGRCWVVSRVESSEVLVAPIWDTRRDLSHLELD